MLLRCYTTAWLQGKYTICCAGAPNANNQEKTVQQLTEQRIWVSLGIFFFPLSPRFFFFPQTINYLRGIYFNTESHAVSCHTQHRVEKRGWFYYARQRGALTLGIRYQMYSAVMGTVKSCQDSLPLNAQIPEKWWILNSGKNREVLFTAASGRQNRKSALQMATGSKLDLPHVNQNS